LVVQYPLELDLLKGELQSFYNTEQPSERSFPSLPNFPVPLNIDTYLKYKGEQVDAIIREKCKGKDDRTAQGIHSAELSKLRRIEDFAKTLSNSMSSMPLSVDLEKEIRESLLEQIMATKPYKANKKQFNGWTTHALREELLRIEEMAKDPKAKVSTPNFGKVRDPVRAWKFKRMRQEIVAANYGEMRSVSRWSELRLVETYKSLEENRKKDPSLPRKPIYTDEPMMKRPQQTFNLDSLLETSDLTAAASRQFKKQKEMSEEDQRKFADTFIKEGLFNQIHYFSDPTTEKLRELIGRPPSPNSSRIKVHLSKSTDSKILKWKVNKDNHELTLLRSDGRVQKISMDDAYSLCAEDHQALLNLDLERDEEDLFALNFELQFKGQIRESLMRNKDQ
jgi:hypothetical protein